MNKYVGGGIKILDIIVIKDQILKENFSLSSNYKMVCNMHPHNYYLEILTETGVVVF